MIHALSHAKEGQDIAVLESSPIAVYDSSCKFANSSLGCDGKVTNENVGDAVSRAEREGVYLNRWERTECDDVVGDDSCSGIVLAIGNETVRTSVFVGRDEVVVVVESGCLRFPIVAKITLNRLSKGGEVAGTKAIVDLDEIVSVVVVGDMLAADDHAMFAIVGGDVAEVGLETAFEGGGFVVFLHIGVG